MISKTLLTSFLILLCIESNGQEVVIGRCWSDYGIAMTLSPDGSKFVISNTSSYLPSLQKSVILSKLDSNDQHVWSNLIFNPVQDHKNEVIARDISIIDDGLLICGTFGRKTLIIKTNLSGKVEWTKTYFNGRSTSIGTNSDDEIILVGVRQETISSKRFGFVMKLDALGKPIWEREYYQGDTHIGHLAISENNQITLSGQVVITTDRNTLTKPFLAKIDNAGNYIWDKVYTNTPKDDFSMGAGGVLNLSTDSSIVCSGGIRYGSSTVSVLLKVDDTNGQIIWSKFYDFSGGITSDFVVNSGEFVLGGYATFKDTSASTGTDIVVIKTNLDGTIKSSKAYGTIGEDGVNGLESDGEKLYLVGSTKDYFGVKVSATQSDSYVFSIDSKGNSSTSRKHTNFVEEIPFSPFYPRSEWLAHDSISASPNSEILLDSVIHGLLDSSFCAPISIPKSLDQNSTQIYPNPCSGTLYIENINEEADIFIYNIRGQVVWRATTYSEKTTVNLSEFKSGLYYVSVKTDKLVSNTTIVLD